ncbi:MAG: cytochrome c biogenesis protein ResB, partial [Gammaproteobacteria bacterium]|nr:cytochrome c biogenesis protein ResB [Gammaproteobacteria bacterium]NIQ74949.1 cytochrome c biogenesis protein ResB [Gammaproteobacteria bacterium]NIR94043.1 cytochrome c biogenesis protein ResB [Gammaproteobacteria bacterium]NIW43732.1 hypothetical protein [Gammaproteobacteria bacterium]
TEDNGDFEQNIRLAMLKVLAQFRQGGMDVIAEYSQSFDDPEQEQAAVATYIQLLHTAMQAIYLSVLEKEGVNAATLSKSQEAFFDDAISALNASHHYGSPFLLELESYDHRQASGLQITRTPGKKLVYLGFTMLITGVFLLFYIHHQRLWVRLQDHSNHVRIIMAGSRARHQRDFKHDFLKLADDLKVITGNRD